MLKFMLGHWSNVYCIIKLQKGLNPNFIAGQLWQLDGY